MPVLEPAEVEWRDDQPYASAFGDIYYSGDGFSEVDRVFLRPTRFAEHIAALLRK